MNADYLHSLGMHRAARRSLAKEAQAQIRIVRLVSLVFIPLGLVLVYIGTR